MRHILQVAARLLATEAALLERLQSPLLLAIRAYWGWQFFQGGVGKLGRIDEIAAWFGGDLGIPMPWLNAYLASGTEAVGGLCLLLGLGGRVATLPLIFTMLVAYATSDREALLAIWSDSDAFVSAAPFLYLLASTIVLVFGPGSLSADHLLAVAWRRAQRPQAASAAS